MNSMPHDTDIEYDDMSPGCMTAIVITLASIIVGVLLVLLNWTYADAQEEQSRVTATLRAGCADLSTHAVNLWTTQASNVYLADCADEAVGTIAPPDGPVLLTEGCKLTDAAYDAIQRLNPHGIIGLGRVCQAVVDEAAMTPSERASLPKPCEGRADVCAGLDRIAACESHNNPRAHNPSGKYHGAWQFDLQTWHSTGRTGDPHTLSYEEQREGAYDLWKARGTQPWSICKREF